MPPPATPSLLNMSTSLAIPYRGWNLKKKNRLKKENQSRLAKSSAGNHQKSPHENWGSISIEQLWMTICLSYCIYQVYNGRARTVNKIIVEWPSEFVCVILNELLKGAKLATATVMALSSADHYWGNWDQIKTLVVITNCQSRKSLLGLVSRDD